MTPGQAVCVENREQHMENQEKADMAAPNGHLVKGERRWLNREQNPTSRQSNKDRHDGKSLARRTSHIQDSAASPRLFLLFRVASLV
jgi:hypothetical protein